MEDYHELYFFPFECGLSCSHEGPRPITGNKARSQVNVAGINFNSVHKGWDLSQLGTLKLKNLQGSLKIENLFRPSPFFRKFIIDMIH